MIAGEDLDSELGGFCFKISKYFTILKVFRALLRNQKTKQSIREGLEGNMDSDNDDTTSAVPLFEVFELLADDPPNAAVIRKIIAACDGMVTAV